MGAWEGLGTEEELTVMPSCLGSEAASEASHLPLDLLTQARSMSCVSRLGPCEKCSLRPGPDLLACTGHGSQQVP